MTTSRVAIPAATTYRRRSALALITATALTTVGGLWLATATAQADPVQVRPGVTCDDFEGVINCTNNTETDYTVVETKQCAGGSWTTTEYDTVWDYSTKRSTTTPRLVFHSTDPETKVANVYVAAHNNALGYNGCDHDTAGVSYAIAAPPPPGQ